jgi:SAM-dependent methyltransferase
MNLNKICTLADFADPTFVQVAREVYPIEAVTAGWPDGHEYRKTWEVVQAICALRFAIHSRSHLLGVGAGHERTSYYLSLHAGQVFCTDLYAAGGWKDWADADMLVDPTPYAGGPFDRQRLVVQHMDGRALQYPDNFFDGVYSSSSIEHFGTMGDVAQAAAEMGRVLKPGGILSLTTEYRLAGPDGGGWGNVRVFNADSLRACIIEPSGCELLDDFDDTMDAVTLATEQDLDWVVATVNRKEIIPAPHIVLLHQGYTFTSCSLALRKPV